MEQSERLLEVAAVPLSWVPDPFAWGTDELRGTSMVGEIKDFGVGGDHRLSSQAALNQMRGAAD